MPPTSSSLSHSVNFSHIKSNGSALLSRPRPRQAGRGEGFYIAAWTGLTEQPFEQRHEDHTDERHTTARHKLFYTQLGVKLCSMAGGGVQKIYMVFLREPSRRDRSGSDLFHLWDGFEIKMNFDRNVSCFIFVNALMHDDFFD